MHWSLNLVENKLQEIWHLLPGVASDATIREAPKDSFSKQEVKGNCGVYVCIYAERFLQNKPLLFSANTVRLWRKVTYCILSSSKETSNTENVKETTSKFVSPPKVCKPKIERKNNEFQVWATKIIDELEEQSDAWDDFETFCAEFTSKALHYFNDNYKKGCSGKKKFKKPTDSPNSSNLCSSAEVGEGKCKIKKQVLSLTKLVPFNLCRKGTLVCQRHKLMLIGLSAYRLFITFLKNVQCAKYLKNNLVPAQF